MAALFEDYMFWHKVNDGLCLFMKHTTTSPMLTLFCDAHGLLEEMHSSMVLTYDDTQKNPAAKSALNEHAQGQLRSMDEDYFMIIGSGTHFAVGLGSNVKKRTKSAKLALAIAIAVDRRVSFCMTTSRDDANSCAACARASFRYCKTQQTFLADVLPLLSASVDSISVCDGENMPPPAPPPPPNGKYPPRPPPPPPPPPLRPHNTNHPNHPPIRQPAAVPHSSVPIKTTTSSACPVVPPLLPEIVWAPTAFETADNLEVSQSVVFAEGFTADGPYVAFGEVVCSERYILWQAHICNRAFRRAPVNFNKIYEFPHMTLAKLERGSAEKRAGKSLWLFDGDFGQEEFDISEVVRILNAQLRRDTTVYRLHSAHLSPNWWGSRYDIGGGEACVVFRRLQRALQQLTARLGNCMELWAQEPAYPHITFEYPDNLEDEADTSSRKNCDCLSDSSKTEHSNTSSMKMVLDGLDSRRLSRLKPIFEREHISRSVLLDMTAQHLEQLGIRRFGDQHKVLQLAQDIGLNDPA